MHQLHIASLNIGNATVLPNVCKVYLDREIKSNFVL